MAPKDSETGFFLIPIAPNLEDTEALREQYFDIIIDRFEKKTNINVIHKICGENSNNLMLHLLVLF